jgi:DNA-binding ferritin-like protein
MANKDELASAQIVKIDEDKRLVFGWASIIKDENGKILLDRQDDFIDSEEELESAAYTYVLNSRDGGEMHIRRGVSKMVESVVFTEEKQRALGIPVGSMPTGWWIGFKVTDNSVWNQVKKGGYAGFSVHGTGRRSATELPISKITEVGKTDAGHPFRGNQWTKTKGTTTTTTPKEEKATEPTKKKKQIIYQGGRRNSRSLMPLGSDPKNYPSDKYELVNPDGTPYKVKKVSIKNIVAKTEKINSRKEISKGTEELVQALSILLADTVSVYHEAHGFHWNVKGQDFSQYHSLFAEIYGDLYGSVDPIAENILKMGSDAPFQMSQLIGLRTITESKPANDPQSMAMELLDAIDSLIDTLNETFDVANRENQQGVANFIAERIDATQKWAWQLRSSVGIQKKK